MMNEIIHSDQVSINKQNCGGKAEGLFFLKDHHFQVPDFFLITSETISQFINNLQLIQVSVDQFYESNHFSIDKLWAVRSSGNVEDGKVFSYAGLFQTITNTNGRELASSIKKVIDSYLAVKNLNYGEKKEIAFSIIIQEMINPDYSGVIFTKNPLVKQDNSIIINIIPGLGENLVSGKEEALTGTCRHRKINWSKPELTYSGEIYSVKLTAVSKVGNEIIKENNALFKKLINGAKKLSKLKGYPLDIEFAIANNQIYWLQVRPITNNLNNKRIWIYDNSNIGENYPGLTLPLSISFVKQTYLLAYKAMARYLGMSKLSLSNKEQLFANMVGDIKGALYYNITAWQQLLYQLPFGKKTSGHIAKILGMDDAEFEIPEGKPSSIAYFKLLVKIFWAFITMGSHRKRYMESCESALDDFSKVNLQSKNHVELIVMYKKLESSLSANWLAPVLNGFYAMILFALLKKFILKSNIHDKYPNFVNDILYSQGDIISVQIVREFQKITVELQQNQEIKNLILKNEAAEIYARLEIEFPSFYSIINNYIIRFGERCEEGELKMEIVNYKEDPLRFIKLLKTMANASNQSSGSQIMIDYKAVINQQYQYHPFKRFLLLKLIKVTLNRIRDRENFRFTRTRIFAMIRIIFRSIDEVLLKNYQIAIKGDSLYLNLDEILDTKLVPEYQAIIETRKNEYKGFELELRANRYQLTGDSLIPVQTGFSKSNNGTIKGIGCCSGTVANKVKIITPESIAQNDFADCILVAKYFEPGWINLFSQALGVISEKGNLLSHTAILCREMGIPSIVGAKGITSMLKNGDFIRMNGATGEINTEYHGE